MLPTQTDDPAATAWHEWVAAHPRIVLVANSGSTDVDALMREPPGTLFVFFNRAFKVLDRPFARRAVLCVGCTPSGPNLVYKREQGRVLPLVTGGKEGDWDADEPFEGVLQVRGWPNDAYAATQAFAPHPVARLDLAPTMMGAYPPGLKPTTGFALACWLASLGTDTAIVLHGFDATRSAQWKLFRDHDWTFEQMGLAALAAAGRIERTGGAEWPMETFLERFAGGADLPPAAMARVLSDRLGGVEGTLDKVWSTLRPVRALDDAWRSLRPRSKRRRARDAAGRT